mgnify:FL=1|jgi:hypothetical protein
MKSTFNKDNFTLDQLKEEIETNIRPFNLDSRFEVAVIKVGKDEIQFKTDRSRHDLYESVLGYVKSLGFRTQPLRDSKPEFKIPKESILFGGKPRNRQISIRILPKSGREYLQTGWENLLILDLKRSRKLPSNMLRTNPDNYAEYAIIRKFNLLVGEVCVDVTIKGKHFKCIAGLVPGSPGAKADFVGVDKNGKPQFYISHKEGSTPTDFQQYSGISNRGSGRNISNHIEVREFVESVDASISEQIKTLKESNSSLANLNRSYWRPIEDQKLKKYAVFGKDFGASRSGINNIDFFAQGNILLRSNLKTRKVDIAFSRYLVGRNDFYKLNNGDYEPTLGTRRGESSRKLGKHNQIRGGIWTSKYIKDRTSEPI